MQCKSPKSLQIIFQFMIVKGPAKGAITSGCQVDMGSLSTSFEKIQNSFQNLTKMPADRVCDCCVREQSASMTLSRVQSFAFGTLELNNWPMKLKCSSMNLF